MLHCSYFIAQEIPIVLRAVCQELWMKTKSRWEMYLVIWMPKYIFLTLKQKKKKVPNWIIWAPPLASGKQDSVIVSAYPRNITLQKLTWNFLFSKINFLLSKQVTNFLFSKIICMMKKTQKTNKISAFPFSHKTRCSCLKKSFLLLISSPTLLPITIFHFVQPLGASLYWLDRMLPNLWIG